MDAQTLGQIYLELVQSFMLYGLDILVMKPCIGRVWVGFRHTVDLRLTGRKPQRGRGGEWVYPPLEDSMAKAVLQEMDTYISHH